MYNTVSEEMFGLTPEDNSRFLECIVIHMDNQGHIVNLNPFAERFLGVDSETLIGKHIIGTLILSHSLNGENQAALFERILGHPKKNGKFDCEIQISDGTVKRVSWAVTVNYDMDGEAEDFVCIGTERQALHKMEEDFYHQSELMETFLDSSKLTVYEMNSEHQYIYISPGIQDLLGFTPEEVAGRSPDLFLTPEEKARVSAIVMDKIRRKIKTDCMVSKGRHKNGNAVWTEATKTYQYQKNGAFAGIFGIYRNVDKQKKNELAMSDREREFRFCLENAQMLLLVTDSDGVIRSINSEGAKMFGKESEQMIGHLFTEFLPDFERERVFQLFKRDFENAVSVNNVRTVEMGGNVNKILAPDGLKDIQFFKTSVKVYEEDRFVGIFHTAVDITEIVKAREELKRHQNHLEQLVAERTAELQGLQEEMVRRERLTALGKIASVISQEIRTPLSTVSNSIFVIKERLKNKEIGAKRSIERAGRAIRRCYDIIEEFKSFTQVDPLRKKLTDIDLWLNQLLDGLSDVKGITIERQINSGIFIEIDPDRLHRAVQNIVQNAIDAVTKSKKGKILVRSQMAFNRLEIEITDSGIGIPRQSLEEIFEPLFSTKSFGLGLGLDITRQILDAHGGGISIESEEEKETKVLLWIPVDHIEMTSN
jgi:PAS domain S-box-containing protein